VTHVWLVAAVCLHVSAQLVRHEEQLVAHRALVLRLAADAVLPQVPSQRVLPEKLLTARAAQTAYITHKVKCEAGNSSMTY